MPDLQSTFAKRTPPLDALTMQPMVWYGVPAGSILILADKNHLPDGVDFELLDFYITPKYRRQGVGKAAARLAFDLHHGDWQVFELARNTPALKFWRAVISEYTNNNFQDLDDGAQQRFRN